MELGSCLVSAYMEVLIGANVPHASHIISLVVLPEDPEHVLGENGRADLLGHSVESGLVDSDMHAGPHANEWIRGGFARMHLDRPERPVLYGNRVGGYRVQCPHCGANMVRALSVALEDWRSGGTRTAQCGVCEHKELIEKLVFLPPAAPARWALVFRRSESADLEPGCLAQLSMWVGVPLRSIVTRG